MNEEEISVSLLDGTTHDDRTNIFGLAKECLDNDCGYWSAPPPEFLLPPPPKPPFLLEECMSSSSPLASAKEPDITGFGRPSAVVSTSDNFEPPSNSGTKFNEFEVCDNLVNPLFVDSDGTGVGGIVSDRIFNLLVILVSSVVLVGIVLIVAIIIWRRYHVSRRTGLLVNKSSEHRLSHLNPDPGQPNDGSNQNYFNSITSSEGKDSCSFGIPSDCRNWRNRRSLREKQLPVAALEMTAAPVPAAAAAAVNINSCHVYSNPNYPHSSLDVCGASSQQIEIGGHPFFLTSGSVAETSLTNFPRSPIQSPVHSKGQSQDEISGLFYEADCSSGPMLSADSGIEPVRSPIVRGERSAPRPYFPPPPPSQGLSVMSSASKDLYANDEESSSAGPIYEDIDRMCSYRGHPPMTAATSLAVKQKDKKKKKTKRAAYDQDHPTPYHTIDINSGGGGGGLRNHDFGVDRIYSNVDDKTTQGNVIVNPMMSSPFHTRLRTMSPASNARPPLSPYSARLAATNTLSSSQSTPTKCNNSMYYYSDTLRHKNSASNRKEGGGRAARDVNIGCRVDSDSGISVSRADFHLDEIPSMRQQILLVNPSNSALTSLTSSPSSSPMSLTTTAAASMRNGTCTSPNRGCTSPPNARLGHKNLVQKFV